jgi:hypothetical protein
MWLLQSLWKRLGVGHPMGHPVVHPVVHPRDTSGALSPFHSQLSTSFLPGFGDADVAAGEFGDEVVGVDGEFLGRGAAFEDVALGHHLGDDRRRKCSGPHHGGEAGDGVKAVDDVVPEDFGMRIADRGIGIADLGTTGFWGAGEFEAD